jgi:hypothetical protein
VAATEFDGVADEALCSAAIVMKRFLSEARVVLALVAVASWHVGAGADTVVRRSGAQVQGEVVAVDDQAVVLRTPSETLRIPRDDVESIHFSRSDPPPPLKVEIRNVRADDAVDVFLEDEVVLRDAREQGEWIDISPRLKDGNNALRLRIHNHRGTWAYRLHLRINGTVTTLGCGTPLDLNGACHCCGKKGNEIGVIEDLPLVWLHVDRAKGTAEVLQ